MLQKEATVDCELGRSHRHFDLNLVEFAIMCFNTWLILLTSILIHDGLHALELFKWTDFARHAWEVCVHERHWVNHSHKLQCISQRVWNWVGCRANYAFACNLLWCFSVRLDLSLIYNDLHERNFTNLKVWLVENDFSGRDQHIELLAFIAHSQIAFDRHILTVEAPSPNICHAFFQVRVVVD